MKLRLARALAVAILLMGLGSANAKQMFPPGIADSVWWSDLIDGEPPLWRLGKLDDFRARIRLSISGINPLKALIRIDEKANGQGIGRVALAKGVGKSLHLVTDTDRTFRVSAEDMKALRARIAEAKLWKLGPEEHWQNDNICIDGEQLIFERVDADGYRFSEANAQCAAPPALRAVAQTMIELSDARDALRLLD